MKKTISIAFIAVISIIIHSFSANAQWISCGPDGGYVKSMAYSGNNIYAVTGFLWFTEPGFYSSTDNGDTWTAVNSVTLPTDIRAVAVSGNSIFLGTGSGIYRSDNNGQTWIAKNNGIPPGQNYINHLVVSNSTLFAAGTSAGMIRSVDNGENWTVSNSGLTDTYIYSLTANETAVFAGTGDQNMGVFRSTDNGNTWQQIKNGMGYYSEGNWIYIYAPVITALGFNGTDLYAGTSENQGIWKTSDNGNNWVFTNMETMNYSEFSAISGNGTVVMAGALNGGGVIRSVNNGQTWTDANSGIDNYGQVTSFLHLNNSNFVGTKGGIYKSVDSGVNWTFRSNGIIAHNSTSPAFAAIGTDIYYGSERGGVFKSSDLGNNWSNVNDGLPIHEWNLSALYSTLSALFAWDRVSLDGGTTWSMASDYSPGCAVYGYNGPRWIEHGNFWYTITWGENAGVLRSMDDGQNWIPINNGISHPLPSGFFIISSGTKLFFGASDGLYQSTDDGETWMKGTFPNLNFWSLNGASIVSTGSTDICGLKGGGGSRGIYRSVNGGVEWSQVSDLLVHKLLINGNSIYASGTNLELVNGNLVEIPRIFMSQDDGQNWSNISESISGISTISIIGDGTRVYVSKYSPGNNRIYCTTNNGATWVDISQGLGNKTFGSSFFIGNDKIFTGTNGRSVWKRNLNEFTIPGQPSAINGLDSPCIGSTQIYSIVKVPGVTYTWQFPAGWTILSGNGTNEVTIQVGSVGGIIIVTPSNVFGTGPAQAKVVNALSPVPAAVSIVANANPVFLGTPVTFTATPVNGGTPYYQWFVNSIAVGDDNAQYSYIPENDDEIYVEMTSGLGCVTNNPAISNAILMSVIPSPPWDFTITGQAHTIIIPASAIPNINGAPLPPGVGYGQSGNSPSGGEALIAAGDWIGVFFLDEIGNEQCGGAVQWNELGVVLTAYGNDQTTPEKDGFAAGEVFKWRLFETISSTEYPAGATYDTSMPNQGNFADFGLSKLTSLQVLLCQEYSFSTGWNSFSSYVVPSQPAVATLFAPMINQLIILRNLTQVYWPDQGINTIGNLNSNSGYVLKTQANVDFEVCGFENASRNLSLSAGWHYLPVLSEYNVNAMELFSSYLNDIVIVQELIGVQIFWPDMGVYSLENLVPGMAYKIKTTAPISLSFPECSSKSNSANAPQVNFCSTIWGNVAMTPSTQMVSFLSTACETFKNGDVIGAFGSDNRPFGMVEINEEGQNQVITLFGNDQTSDVNNGFEENEVITYKLLRTSSGEQFELQVEYDQTMDNTTGNFYSGSFAAIVNTTMQLITVNDLISAKINMYPNPAKDVVNFDYSGSTDELVKVEIFDAKGQLVNEVEFSHKTQMNTTSLDAGVYFVKITTQTHTEVRKLIKQ